MDGLERPQMPRQLGGGGCFKILLFFWLPITSWTYRGGDGGGGGRSSEKKGNQKEFKTIFPLFFRPPLFSIVQQHRPAHRCRSCLSDISIYWDIGLIRGMGTITIDAGL